MAKVFTVVFLLLNALGLAVGIKLDGNGYTDILIAINPAVPENKELITQIKEMITSGSEYLFQALNNIVFFKEVNILVPPTWYGTYEKAIRETYEKANVIIDQPNPEFGDEPYTKQMKGCGEEGEHIHFTPDFLLEDHFLNTYGPRGKVFVHEWAHLRWGVFDEYNKRKPFYLSGKQIEATRCIRDISGKRFKVTNGKHVPCVDDVETGLPTEGCLFFPDREQETSASIMYMQSLDSVKAFCSVEEHNTEAPNMQNEKCDYKATHTVIFQESVDSDALNTLTPLQSSPPAPIFKLIQRQHRIVCLILDVSGSMQENERLLRLQQAATLFLSEIVEKGAHVGIVQFSTKADIVSPLTEADDKASRDSLIRKLPKTASGKTNMCTGLQLGFEVLRKDDGSTNGDEVIFLTDGEATDKVEDCLQLAVNSGAIINTIALGPTASNVLKTMANLTDGKFILANQTLLSNQLVEAFSFFSMSDGDLTKQTIQLVSTGKTTADWFNGTVPIDRTVGNSTTFTIIYERSTPTVYIESPSGQVYNQAHITENTATKMITLNIPGTTEPGDWKYSFLNKPTNAQSITLTVMSRAAHEDVPPITVNAKTNQPTSDGSKPMVVHADVRQKYLPVLGAKVMATLESDTGHSEHLYLLDNGAGADSFKDDGVYFRYFTKFKTGRYNLKVHVTSKDGDISLSPRRYSGALYVPGYIVNGELELNPPKPPIKVQPADVGNFTRTATGESFVVIIPPDVPQPNFPPNRVTDLSAEIQEDTVLLNWTAPGEDYDQGTAKSYEIKWSESLETLQKNFSSANPLNTSALQPQEAGLVEQHSFLPDIPVQNGTTLFFALRSEDKGAIKSEVSNIAGAKKFVPGSRPAEILNPGLNLSTIVISICVVAVVVSLIVAVIRWAIKLKKTGGFLLETELV
ncbi:calcium-activated chloride channel regulator 1-like [Salminus brasiliensis]|uniref:calcium-activated chloride channel regulator 1-like n=1 Tax=Salminus brasiliensis TaxID=930266 RepID=UPI003B82CB6F